MSLNDKMTGLMNSVRSKCALTQKMTLSEATDALNKVEPSEPLDYYFDGDPNQSVKTKTSNDIKYESTVNANNVGAYFFCDNSVIVPGERYLFSTLVRGNFPINVLGFEGNQLYTDISLEPKTWRLISWPFTATKGAFLIYGIAKKGQWLELKEPQFFKLGG